MNRSRSARHVGDARTINNPDGERAARAGRQAGSGPSSAHYVTGDTFLRLLNILARTKPVSLAQNTKPQDHGGAELAATFLSDGRSRQPGGDGLTLTLTGTSKVVGELVGTVASRPSLALAAAEGRRKKDERISVGRTLNRSRRREMHWPTAPTSQLPSAGRRREGARAGPSI